MRISRRKFVGLTLGATALGLAAAINSSTYAADYNAGSEQPDVISVSVHQDPYGDELAFLLFDDDQLQTVDVPGYGRVAMTIHPDPDTDEPKRIKVMLFDARGDDEWEIFDESWVVGPTTLVIGKGVDMMLSIAPMPAVKNMDWLLENRELIPLHRKQASASP